MSQIKVKGIVVTDINFSESSKILNILTLDYGLIGVISKGCRNLKSKLRSTSSKLTYGYFYLNYKDEKLSTLTEVEVLDEFKNIKKDLTKIGCAFYLIDLAKQVIKEDDSSEVFSILEQALLKMENGLDPLLITNIVEYKYLRFLGVMPVTNKCASCGSDKNIVTINGDAGGYLCKSCYNGEYIVDEKTIKLLNVLNIIDISKIKELNIPDKNKKELNTFLENYYIRYTGLYLKSKDFLNQIK